QNYWDNSFGLVLADKVCRYLAGDSVIHDWNFVCGETVSMPLPSQGDLGGFTLRGPGLPVQGLALNPPPADPQKDRAGRLLPVTRAEQPGNYRVDAVRDNKAELFGRFSLNVRPEENVL